MFVELVNIIGEMFVEENIYLVVFVSHNKRSSRLRSLREVDTRLSLEDPAVYTRIFRISSMKNILFLYYFYLLFLNVESGRNAFDSGTRKVEDSIPIIEIRGEGKPMTSEQIRKLEEITNGGPVDIKIDKTFVPSKCEHKAERGDFVTFHYKVFTEDGRRVFQSYGADPVRIQLGAQMTLPGLDKGLMGICSDELRKIQIPYRLLQGNEGKAWLGIPKEEHWVSISCDIQTVQPVTEILAFNFLDVNNNTFIDNTDLLLWQEQMKENFDKKWPNDDVDNAHAAKYFITYFDVSGDGRIDSEEFSKVMSRDRQLMDKTPADKITREANMFWILDFDNDGIITDEEIASSAERFEKVPSVLPNTKDEL